MKIKNLCCCILTCSSLFYATTGFSDCATACTSAIDSFMTDSDAYLSQINCVYRNTKAKPDDYTVDVNLSNYYSFIDLYSRGATSFACNYCAHNLGNSCIPAELIISGTAADLDACQTYLYNRVLATNPSGKCVHAMPNK